MTTRRTASAALGLSVALAAAGCGGATKTPSTPTAAAGSATSPSPTAASTAPAGSATPSSATKSVAPVPVESNPPGDIPDNLAFVRYANTAGHYVFTHPEGWARTETGQKVRFTDKLNGVLVDSLPATKAPTAATARASDVPRLQASVPAFQLRSVSAASLPGGRGVHIVFRRNSDPDPVTGKVFRDEVEEYDVYSGGRLVRLDLFGPVGADNVDAYRTMAQSLRIR